MDSQTHQHILSSYNDDFLKYLRCCEKRGDIIKAVSSSELWDLFSARIKDLEKIKGLKVFLLQDKTRLWPYVHCHGDLSARNILLYADNYYIIDWEHSDLYPFFYDSLNFIISEALKSNTMILEDYFKGEYDPFFKSLFEIVGVTYQENERPYYIAICIIIRMLDRNYMPGTKLYTRYITFADVVLSEYA